LLIPKVVDDYNHYIGGVDIADQYRSNYIIQHPVRRTWYPLFFWLLDVSIVNSFLIYKIKHGKKNASHKKFRMDILWELIKEAIQLKKSKFKGKKKVKVKEQESFWKKKSSYLTKNFKLSVDRLFENKHLPTYTNQRKSCTWCREIYHKKHNQASKSPVKTNIYCSFCDVFLCCNSSRNCFFDYHTKESDN
jgi:hypothetical protein